MLGPNEIEQIIRLINKGFSLELLALELGISLEQIQSCQQQLELRKFAKQSVKKRKQIGFSKDIDEILDRLDVQIPKKKNSNIRKKVQSSQTQTIEQQETNNSIDCNPKSKKTINQSYEKAIKRYQEEIAKNPQKSLNKRNILAFAYFKSGRIDEARDELMSLIDEYSSYMAYRQLIHIEKSEGNFEDARFWADACLEQFPNSIDVRHQLVSVAIEDGNHNEAIKQLRKILSISPENERGQKTLASIDAGNSR